MKKETILYILVWFCMILSIYSIFLSLSINKDTDKDTSFNAFQGVIPNFQVKKEEVSEVIDENFFIDQAVTAKLYWDIQLCDEITDTKFRTLCIDSFWEDE